MTLNFIVVIKILLALLNINSKLNDSQFSLVLLKFCFVHVGNKPK